MIRTCQRRNDDNTNDEALTMVHAARRFLDYYNDYNDYRSYEIDDRSSKNVCQVFQSTDLAAAAAASADDAFLLVAACGRRPNGTCMPRKFTGRPA